MASIDSIVLSRDYDPLTIMSEMLQPIKVVEKSWVVRRVTVDRGCVGGGAVL